MSITIAIVEDNAGVCSSLETVIAEAGNEYTCVCTCSTAEKALKFIPKEKPDVVLMDIELPKMTGIECTAELKRILPDVKILMLTGHKNSEKIFKAFEAGASGYLLKRSTPDEIIHAIRQVNEGGAPMTGEIARKVVSYFRKPAAPSPEIESLSRREEEVLNLLAEAHSSKEIASKLSISYDTVCTHLKHIYAKLHVRSRMEAVMKLTR